MSQPAAAAATARQTANMMLLAVSLAHLLNDLMQNAVPAVFPVFQQSLKLSFAQIGWIAFTLNVTASVLQPLIGYYTDRRPMPGLLPLGMLFTLFGMAGLAYSSGFAMLIVSASLIGVGSSVLHPESSRVAHLAAGRQKGLAQSIFQVGGNTGQALAPLLVAMLIVPLGQQGFVWFCLFALAGIAIQMKVSKWYARKISEASRQTSRAASADGRSLSRGFVLFVMTLLIVLLFSKFVYIACMTGYYSFYLWSATDCRWSGRKSPCSRCNSPGWSERCWEGRWPTALAAKG